MNARLCALLLLPDSLTGCSLSQTPHLSLSAQAALCGGNTVGAPLVRNDLRVRGQVLARRGRRGCASLASYPTRRQCRVLGQQQRRPGAQRHAIHDGDCNSVIQSHTQERNHFSHQGTTLMSNSLVVSAHLGPPAVCSLRGIPRKYFAARAHSAC